jgi:two-component system, NarL family, response regulator DevR
MNCGTISSFLITHNRLLGEALTRTIGEEPDLRVLGAAPFCPGTMETIVSEDPDIVVTDSTFDTASKLEIVPEIRRCAPRAKVVLIGMEADREIFLDAVRDGIVGYVLNDASSKEVVEAVRAVARGAAICPPTLCLTLFQVACGVGLHAGRRLGLTRREQQLADMIGQGLTNKEIASQLFVSEHTVKNQIHRMLHKLGVSRRLAIVELCRKSTHLVA